MPYIKQDRRRDLGHGVDTVAQDAGELNYLLTMLVLGSDVSPEDDNLCAIEMRTEIDLFLKNKGELRYAHINDVIGAVTGAKLEMIERTGKNDRTGLFDAVLAKFYSEVARPYEDTKIAENGDVYDSVQS